MIYMNKTALEFCKRLNIEYNEEIDSYYEKGLILYKEKGFYALNKERLIKLNSEYNIFRKWFDDVLKATDEIKKDDDLILYIYILITIIEDNVNPSILPPPDRNRMDTDFTPLYSLLYFFEDMIERMKKRGVDKKIISDTLNGFDTEMNDYYDRYGRSGMRNWVGWFTIFVRTNIYRIGRLQFEITKLGDKIKVYKKDEDVKIFIDGNYIHKKGMLFGSARQDDEEGKIYAQIETNGNEITGYCTNEFGEANAYPISLSGYNKVLEKGDYVLSVHIPSHEAFTPEVFNKSFEDAREFFKKCFPDYDFKAFWCISWMLEKRLKHIMQKDTNITRFADKFVGYPIKTDAKLVYPFVFKAPASTKPEELPENSSMQKKIKEYLVAGNEFYEKGGIMIFE